MLHATAQNDIKTTTSSSIDHPVQYTVNFFLLKKKISHWDYFIFYGNNLLSIEINGRRTGNYISFIADPLLVYPCFNWYCVSLKNCNWNWSIVVNRGGWGPRGTEEHPWCTRNWPRWPELTWIQSHTDVDILSRIRKTKELPAKASNSK